MEIRRLYALALLAAFAAGGVVAPAVHHAEHGLAHAERAEAAAAHTAHVHADEAAFTEALPHGLTEHGLCIVCAPRPLVETWLAEAPAPAVAEAPSLYTAPVTFGTTSRAACSIRGPPSA